MLAREVSEASRPLPARRQERGDLVGGLIANI